MRNGERWRSSRVCRRNRKVELRQEGEDELVRNSIMA